MKRILKPSLLLLLTVSVAVSCLIQFFCYRYDNKYTYTRPQSENGLIRLNMDWYDNSPFFYLVDDWAFYDGKLLTPENIGAHTPDAHFYIGRYGGLNRNDTSRSAAGQATYRMVIETDETPRSFSIELSGVYDRHRLWVNGELMQSVGYEEDMPTVRSGSVVTFTAAEKIELVVAVESDGSGFYSGMVYPPAIGSPDEVSHIAYLRLLLHASGCAVALLVCVMCLILALGRRFHTPYAYLGLLALCFCGLAAWPFYQEWGWMSSFIVWERVCYYGIFLSLILIQNRICNVPKKTAFVSGTVGVLVCLAMLLRPLLPFSTAAVNLAWSQALTVYKWLTAVYLLGCALWAVRKEAPYSKVLLAGNCAFAAALVMNRLLPMHEPVLLGWNVEIIGFLWVCLLTGVIGHDAVQTYRERAALETKQALSQMQLDAQLEHARLQQDYVRRTREGLHESRSRLTLIRHYLDMGETEKLDRYLAQLTEDSGDLDSMQHTGNSLIDAILTIQLTKAEELGTYVEQDFSPLPERLPIEDADLTSLLMNITQNALEALSRISDPAERWMRLRLDYTGDVLIIECENATVPGEKQAQKADRQAHGFGLPIIRSIAAKYHGKAVLERQEESYFASVSLHPEPVKRENEKIQG